jgi:opacity protein-like surface antigen
MSLLGHSFSHDLVSVQQCGKLRRIQGFLNFTESVCPAAAKNRGTARTTFERRAATAIRTEPGQLQTGDRIMWKSLLAVLMVLTVPATLAGSDWYVSGSGTSVGWTTEFDSGTAFSFEAGKRYSSGLRSGIEVSWANADVDFHDGVTAGGTLIDGVDAAVLTGSATQLGATVGEIVAAGQGEIETMSMMANAYYDFNRDGRFSPYLGAGIGFSSVDVTFNPSGVGIVRLARGRHRGRCQPDPGFARHRERAGPPVRRHALQVRQIIRLQPAWSGITPGRGAWSAPRTGRTNGGACTLGLGQGLLS